ncbi:MAG TPA: hypothetical protein DFS52_30120 [Myxococcales bacterium]|nr:hypothetical protein [Myxococcales bacterium]
MRVATSRRKKASAGIPKKVREEVVARLEPQMERYLESGAAEGFELSFEGKYLAVAARTSSGRRSQMIPLYRQARELGFRDLPVQSRRLRPRG